MNAAEPLAASAAEISMVAFQVLAGLITGFAVLLGLVLFVCGMALTLAEVVGSVRDARRSAERPSSVPQARAGR